MIQIRKVFRVTYKDVLQSAVYNCKPLKTTYMSDSRKLSQSLTIFIVIRKIMIATDMKR